MNHQGALVRTGGIQGLCLYPDFYIREVMGYHSDWFLPPGEINLGH